MTTTRPSCSPSPPPPPLADGRMPTDLGIELGGAAGRTRREEKRRLRDQNADIVAALVRRTGRTHAQVNGELNRLAGIVRVTEATVTQLRSAPRRRRALAPLRLNGVGRASPRGRAPRARAGPWPAQSYTWPSSAAGRRPSVVALVSGVHACSTADMIPRAVPRLAGPSGPPAPAPAGGPNRGVKRRLPDGTPCGENGICRCRPGLARSERAAGPAEAVAAPGPAKPDTWKKRTCPSSTLCAMAPSVVAGSVPMNPPSAMTDRPWAAIRFEPDCEQATTRSHVSCPVRGAQEVGERGPASPGLRAEVLPAMPARGPAWGSDALSTAVDRLRRRPRERRDEHRDERQACADDQRAAAPEAGRRPRRTRRSRPRPAARRARVSSRRR